jgi:hypothetical protein
MKQHQYTERQIIAIMHFTGLTRQESIDYFKALTERENKMIIRVKQESEVLDELIASFNSQSKLLSN